jgi:murein DD-endopeptidase MepM/ murein hydrolase activator NlpD
MTRKIHRTRPLAALVAAAAAVAACEDTPDVGRLAAVEARPVEWMDVRTLSSGQTLGEVLDEVLDVPEQQALLLAFREQASPRRMKVGTEIALRYGRDDLLRGVDVALNADETVRLTREGVGWGSALMETPIFTDTLLVVGTIEESLWTSLMRNRFLDAVPYNDRGVLVDHLDKVFQWQLDFSRQIQRGDGYRVAFERQVRPNGTMRSGHIIAAEFVNLGTPYHAVWFDPNDDGRGSYYDLDGTSVRRAFLAKPLEFRRISSRYTNARFHPVLNTWRAHRGVDYAADRGTPIMATADGLVQQRGALGGLGNAVVIRHANGFTTRYGHMSRFAAGVVVGTRLRQGDIIGYVGSTGLATGPHLHYEMLRNGTHVDPLAVELPSGDPVPADDLARWQLELGPRIALIDSLPEVGGLRVARSATALDSDATPAATPGSAGTSDGVSGREREGPGERSPSEGPGRP